MGSSASKAAKAAGPSTRKFPTRTPTATTTRAPQPPRPVQPPPPAPSQQAPPTSGFAEIDTGAPDPGLASRLSTLGAVQPNPHYSPSSFSNLDPQRQRNPSHDFPSDMMQAPPPSAFPDPRDNPALRLLEARENISKQAEREIENMGRRGFEGRSCTDASTIQLALMRKKRGEPVERIEKAYSLKKGALSVLGRGIVDTVQ